MLSIIAPYYLPNDVVGGPYPPTARIYSSRLSRDQSLRCDYRLLPDESRITTDERVLQFDGVENTWAQTIGCVIVASEWMQDIGYFDSHFASRGSPQAKYLLMENLI